MEYYIDGHNLIPKVNGIRLSDENDEMELLERIQEFSRITRKKCTVFFDKAPENKTRSENYGTLRVYYVTHRNKADEEIIAHVNNLGKKRAGEITVVSSDRHVQWQCHQSGAAIMNSEIFAEKMAQIFISGSKTERTNKSPMRLERKLSSREVEEWLEIFSEKKDQ